MLNEDLQLFDEVVCTRELILGGSALAGIIPANTRGYYLPTHIWSSTKANKSPIRPKLVYIIFEKMNDFKQVSLEEIQLVKRNTAEDLVNHSILKVKEAARDKVLQCLLKKGPVRAIAGKNIDDQISLCRQHLSEGERFVIIKRKKFENFAYLKEAEASRSCEYVLKELRLVDWSTLSLVSKEELLTSANQSLRELAIDKNALSYGKLIQKFNEQRSLTKHLFVELLYFFEGVKKGNGFGLTNFPALQRKKLLEVLNKEFSRDLINRTAALNEDLDKTFQRLENRFKGFIEEEKANAKEAFINQAAEE
jgi:hypothetical protein